MKIRIAYLIIACLLCFGWLYAQEETSEIEQLKAKTSSLESTVAKLSRFKVTGFIQTQYQYAQWGVDGYNFKLQNRQNSVELAENQDFGRFGLRRARLKVTYDEGLVQVVFQPDFSFSGVSVKDASVAVRDPFFGTNSIKMGLFARPFGHETAYSSSLRESPERTRMTQTLFPDDRDIGVMLTLQPAKTSPLHPLKLEGGLFVGNGIGPQVSRRMDFIGHLTMTQSHGQDVVFSMGVSAYLGGVLQNDASVYIMKDGYFQLREQPIKDNINRYAKRQYIGADAQLKWITVLGLTHLRAEYVFGEHAFPGGVYAKLNSLRTGPVFMRQLNGGYIVLAHDIGRSPATLVVKYDWYDPNTAVEGDDIAKDTMNNMQEKTGSGDIKKSTIGLGLLYHFNPSLKLTAYYDIVKTETTIHLKDVKNGSTGKLTEYGYENRRKENVFTLRLQYKF